MPHGNRQETRYTALEPPAPGPRGIRFPGDRSYGDIVVRDWGSPVYGGYDPDWKELGFQRAAEARGPVSIPAGPAGAIRSPGPTTTAVTCHACGVSSG